MVKLVILICSEKIGQFLISGEVISIFVRDKSGRDNLVVEWRGLTVTQILLILLQ